MRLKVCLLLAFIFIAGCHTTQQISDSKCELYKTGDFLQNEYNNSGLGHWNKMSLKIHRTDSIEMIISSGTRLPDDTTYYKIEWLNTCSYQLTYISSNNTWVDSLIKNRKLPVLQTYFIVKGNENYYIQKSSAERDTIWIRRS